jgi:predicted acyl esterase
MSDRTATQPPRLAARCVRESWSDNYRDGKHHGRIICSFRKNWQDMQLKTVQHGVGKRGAKNRVTGEMVCGPEIPSEEQLARNREDMWAELHVRELVGPYCHECSLDSSSIIVPPLTAANPVGPKHARRFREGFVCSESETE